MKKIVLIIFGILLVTNQIPAQETGTITDSRDGQIYNIVKIGNQWWMAENLNSTHYADGTPLVDGTGAGDITNDYTTKYYFYYNNDSATYADTYGALYTWAAVMNGATSSNNNPSGVQGVCPDGWHVPSDTAWKELEMYLGMSQTDADNINWRGTDEGGKLKEAGTTHWDSPNTGATNSSDFTALPGGFRYDDGSYGYVGGNATFWSSTEYTSGSAWTRVLANSLSEISRTYGYKDFGYSVRCVRDIDTLAISLIETDVSSIGGTDGSIVLTVSGGLLPYTYSWSTGATSEDISGLSAGVYSVSVTDARDSTATDSVRIYDTFIDERDAQVYKAINIGDQIWMAENLNSTHYADSTPLIDGTGAGDITGDYTTKYRFWYDDDSVTYAGTYGALYTWAAAMNGAASSDNNPSGVQGVCPDGWHLPGDAEWKQLEMYLGMNQAEADGTSWRGTDEGGKLKETGTTHCTSPNTGATNESGFSGLPGGARDYNGTFFDIGSYGYWCSATEGSAENAWYRCLSCDTSAVDRSCPNKSSGFSVRCVKTYSLYTDSLALVALYDSTDGANWTNNSEWLDVPVSTWYGVTVSGDRVSQIGLHNNNLVGTIPPEIYNLTNLNWLQLSLNQLSGSIPTEIGNLINLTSLNLSNNQLSGSIPIVIWNLTNLTTLTLAGNQLTGQIPTEIGNLTNLIALKLHLNQLSGSIPIEIGNLTNLTYLNLGDNQFTGSIPSEIGSLTNLTSLWLSNNQFTYLPDLSSLTNITNLSIQNNQFTFEDIEPNIGITGFVYSPQDSVGQIIDTTVYVGTSYTMSVSTGGASSQYQWKKDGVSIGSISSDSTYSIIPIAFSDSGTYTCEITNTVATALTLYSRPINVIVDYPPFQKDSLALIALYNSTNGAGWTNSSNWLGENVSTWYGITVSGNRVTEINLNNNNLTGSIPPEIGNLTNLSGLGLYVNQLTGSIPSEIWNMTNLGMLLLDGNQLSGTIPSSIGNLINLEALHLFANQLSGSIPNEIGNLTKLTSIWLSNNKLSGAIPSDIINLTKLYYLRVDDNQFTDLPNLSPLDSLDELKIENNKFTFKDIEPSIGVAITTFTYAPQDSVGEIIYTTVYPEANLMLSVSTGGTNSLYQWKKDGTNIGNISADSTYTIISFTSSDLGTYTCEITNTVATDLTLYSRPIYITITGGPIISGFPYLEDFESGNDDWYTGGTNSSWQYGIPAGSTINSAASGTNAWVTNLTGDYNPDEISYITSPRFNLSGINYPKIEFSIWWYSEGFYDGANFQYKQGTGEWKTLGTDQGDDSWYNSSYIYSIEKGFGFDINNSAGWSGDDEWGYGSDGWVTVSHALTGIDNRSDVTFRIAFASNSGYENDGIAIDDINIFSDPTGIDPVETGLSDIQIYPNPNEGKFRLVYNGERDVDLKLQLINLQGQVILSEHIETGYRFSKEFELDYLPPGIYYFRLMHKEGVIVKKMVVR